MRGLLRVDLSTGRITKETIPAEIFDRWVGGGGINDWLLWEHFLRHDPMTDARSPDNVMIFGVGPLAGIGSGIGVKGRLTFKSPCYNMFGDSAGGGAFPYVVRFTGYDHIVITGRAAQPVYLRVRNDDVAICDASHLWGKNASETHAALRQELGDFPSEAHSLCIGQAGEHLVGFASVISDGSRAHGRCGAGCVFGSKNLKAITAQGNKGVPIHDPQTLFEWAQTFRAEIDGNRVFDGFKRRGTLGAIEMYNTIGGNYWRNNQGIFIESEAVRSDLWLNKFHRYAKVCSADCFLACDGEYKLTGDESPLAERWAGESYRHPEFLTVAATGGALDLQDMAAIAHLGKVSTDYGMDIQEIGGILGYAMELWQRGLLTGKDTDELLGKPLALKWGDIDVIEALIDSLAFQNNRFGQLFRDGVYRGAVALSQERGEDLLKYAVYGKGGAPFTEEMRPFPTWLNNMAVAARGADHLKGLGQIERMQRRDISMAYFGRPEAADPTIPDLKGAASAALEDRVALINAYGVCIFHWSRDPLGFTPEGYFGRLYNAVMGMDKTPEELLRDAQRINNLEKAFNSRLGLRRQDDTICERWMHEPCPAGPYQGRVAGDMFDSVLEEYYAWRGWDRETGLQTRQKLIEVGLEDVADVLAKEGALVE